MNSPGPRVRVKICGVTNAEDAQRAIALGADALGFNLYPGSKRCVDLAREEAWIRTLPPLVTRVAVLVNVPLDAALAVAAHPAIDLVQFHGDEDERYCARFAESERAFLKAVRLRDGSSVESVNRFSTSNILLDADAGAAFGGTGRYVDLALAAETVRRFPQLRIVLAGGLRPETVAAAAQAVGPYAVDVASGVEEAPGRKSEEKMRAFFAALAG